MSSHLDPSDVSYLSRMYKSISLPVPRDGPWDAVKYVLVMVIVPMRSCDSFIVYIISLVLCCCIMRIKNDR